MKNWKIPTVILLILLLVIVFRWHTVASKTSDREVMKWTVDTWTQQVWLEKYAYDVSIEPVFASQLGSVADAKARALRDNLSIAWATVTTLDAVWLLYALVPLRKRVSI